MSLPPADLDRLKLVDLDTRPSKVDRQSLGKPWKTGGSLAEFARRLPDVLAAKDLCQAAETLAIAVESGRPVILGMGAHVIKVGLSPLVIDALERGVISAVAMNGAGVVHDTEMALAGRTSEDVAAALADGSFGTARQTGELINNAVADKGPELGLGRAVGEALLRAAPSGLGQSILATCARLDKPALIFVAMGTDIIHMHPSCDPAATGAASHRDFRTLVSLVGDLKGGAFINAGSAVVIPEVFLKALSAARNLGHDAHDFFTLNLDMIAHYRPLTNVVGRPVLTGGKGMHITGHHEINLPLLLALVKEELGLD